MSTLSKVARFVGKQFGRQEPAPAGQSPTISIDALESDYEGATRDFYAYLPDDVRDIFIGDAIYHKAGTSNC